MSKNLKMLGRLSTAGLVAFAVTGCETSSLEQSPKASNAAMVNPEIWPKGESPIPVDPQIEARLDTLLSQMTVRQKIGQIVQADIGSITPKDLETYPLGSILNGGNSAPNGDNRSPASAWLALADEFWDATKRADLDGGPFIPMIWGTDAVHGHNNIPGATVFPHNIGLGATRDPDLMAQIGAITAKEIRVGGQEWTFAPTIAVVRDDRWGRTYEGYAETPEVTVSYAGELIRGIQGEVGTEDFLKGSHVIATAKHFLGDGGTNRGRDQGDNLDSEEELRDIHGAAYPVALDAGAQSVMISFSSWQGAKLHGHKGLITDVLKGQMGFDGFVVGDWNAHGQLDGCSNTNCLAALHAGLDMYMAPDSWQGLFDSLLSQAKSGEMDMARLDDAVARILRVKLRAGLFEAPRPSKRAYAGDYEVLKDPASKAVARQAVRESLVLLKNDGVLPLSPNSTVLVAGDGADNIGKQSGGWTLSWQGTGNENSDFPGGTSVFDGINRHVMNGGGRAVLSVDGSYMTKPDVAVVVFGEDPYAEFKGDIDTLFYKPGDLSDLALLQKFQAENVPVIAVFLSGRPLWMNREINASNAFVAAWLPGSEGGYMADVLFKDNSGQIAYDFKGTLPYSWPKTAGQTDLNIGDESYDPLFAYGYGLSYAKPASVAVLSEDPEVSYNVKNDSLFFKAGKAVFPWALIAGDESGKTEIVTTRGTSPSGHVKVMSMDDGVQENIRTLSFTGAGPASVEINGAPIDLSRQNTGDMALYMRIRPEDDNAKITVSLGCETGCEKTQDLNKALTQTAQGEWAEISLKLSCFGAPEDMMAVETPITLSSSGKATLSVSDVKLVSNEGQAVCLNP